MTIKRIGLIEMGTGFSGKDIRGDVRSVLDAIKVGKKAKLDAIIGPEFSLVDKNRIVEKPAWRYYYTDEEHNRLISLLESQSKDSKMLVIPGTMVYMDGDGNARNLLPVISDGALLHSYHKRLNGGTTSFFYDSIVGRTNPPFAAGRESNVFEYRGERIGLEVCADTGRLSYNNVKDLDLQILSSCGIQFTNHVIKEGGIFVLTDGYSKRASLSVLSAGKMDLKNPLYKNTLRYGLSVDPIYLSIYNIQP